MKLQEIIDLLKKSGCNSKKQVIQLLENATDKELYELAKDCYKIVAERSVNK